MDDRLKNALDRVEDRLAAFKPGGSEKLAIDTTGNGTGHGTPRLGTEAAANMLKLSTTAAADVRKLGDLAASAGTQLQQQCYQMADDIEANGKTISSHLTGFAQLLADIGMSNRETHARLLRGEPSPNRAEEARQELEKVIEEEFVPEDPPHEPTV
jgi:hypothetical protein